MSTENTQLISSKTSQDAKDPPAVSFWKLLRYASSLDWFLMITGALAAIASGAALPFFALLFGDMTNALSPTTPPDVMISVSRDAMLKFFWVGLGMLVTSWLQVGFWMITGERQAIRFREEYFRALLRQEIGWFDQVNPSEFTSKIAEECFTIQSGLGEKVSTLLNALSTVIAGFIVGFIKGWQLSLVLCSMIPLIAISGTIFVSSIQKQAVMGSKAYTKAGALAEQALAAIRTVVGLGGEEKELNAYKAALVSVKRTVIRFGFYSAFAFGFIYLCNGLSYFVGFWVGGVFVGEKRINPVTGTAYNVGDVLTVFFAVTIGAFSISMISPSMKAITQARVAGGKVLSVINRKSQIDHEDKSGDKPTSVRGVIEFKNVYFNYPANREKPVLQGLDLIIEPNKKTALVGVSGCGKSTCMQLIERFYDPDSGEVTLDGKPLRTLNIKWLRENIGYVGQEPVLFSASVRENLKMAKPDATDDEMIQALKQANAWDFLSPEKSHGKGLDTYVGTSGAQLSGGQKQRIAIARAILKNPRILLLDEATSALDRTNEKIIQSTLDEIAKGRTTIVIAHRLSTVRNADKIVLFHNGKIIESGNHDELVRLQGKYFEMQKTQLQPEELEKHKHQAEITHRGKHRKSLQSVPFINEDECNLKPSFIEERPSKNKVSSEENLIDIPVSTKADLPEENNKETLKTFENGNNVNLEPGSGPESSGPTSPKSDNAMRKETETALEVKPVLTKRELRARERKKKLEKKQLEKEKRAVMKKLFAYTKPERLIFYLAALSSIINGTVFPFYAVVLSFILQTMALPESPNFMSDIRLLAFMFLVLGFASLIFYGTSLALFSVVAENLTARLRADVFHKMLRMHMSWHDDPANNPGALAGRLSSATVVNTLVSTAVGASLQIISSFTTGVIVSFVGSWRVTLVGLALSPIQIICSKIQADFGVGFAAKTDEAYRGAGVFVMEALTNMRTVASLGKEGEMLSLYSKALQKPKREALKRGLISGFLFGFSQLGGFFVFGVVFYAGSVFMRDHGLQMRNVFQAIFGILFATWDMGNAMQLMPDASKATGIAKTLFNVLDTESKIDYMKSDGKCKEPIQGEIEFKDVFFKYPVREKQVLDNLSFRAPCGSKIALVGPSGCGKSTVIQLLQRFYDVDQGEILIDGRNIKSYDISHLRKHIGTVSQEPVLFYGTILENVR